MQQNLLRQLMKPLAQFTYEKDIVEELQKNAQNLKTLFRKRFVQDIEKQKRLTLNYIYKPEEKQKLLNYLTDSAILNQVKERLKKDPFISEFLANASQQDKKFPSFDAHFLQITKIMETKAKKNNTSLTFYNQYARLYKDINNCFQYKKNFTEGEVVVDNGETFEEIIYYTLFCQYCNRGFKEQSGLSAHQLHFCSKRPQATEKSRESAENLKPKAQPKRKIIHKQNKLEESQDSD